MLGPLLLELGMCTTSAPVPVGAIQPSGWSKGGHPLPVTAERHPPDYRRHGRRRAPWVRNSQMVADGADLCLAFIRDESNGASGTAAMAEAAQIMTQRFYYVGGGAP